MIHIDWAMLAFGLAIGALMSAMFFMGLGLGIRVALRSAHPVRVLMLSAGLRTSCLLGGGWPVVDQAGPWSLLGYAAAFVLVRAIAILVARARLPIRSAE